MPQRSYKEITKCLTILAFWGGNYTSALKAIREEGIPLAETTLKGWATGKYAEDYEQIKLDFRHSFMEETVATMQDVITRAAEAEKLAIERVHDTMYATDDPKAAAQAGYYMSQVKKNNVEKLQVMTGQPTHIIEDRTPEAALKSLIQRGIIKPVQSELKVIDGGGES